MDASGFGLRFTEKDIKLANRVKVLLESVDYKMEGAVQVVQAAEAMTWFARLVPQMQSNILELVDETKVPDAPPSTEEGGE